jgi:uncharacterized protein YjbI with pentapeptide repeats
VDRDAAVAGENSSARKPNVTSTDRDVADRFRETVKARVTHVTRLYYAFIFFVLYLLITVGAMDDSYAIRHDVGVRLPLFNVQVGARAFGLVAPILLLGFELYVFVEQWLLARGIVRYVKSDENVSRAQLMIPWLLYPEPRGNWKSWPPLADWTSRGAYWIAASSPTIVLLALQWRYTASHLSWLTGLQTLVIVMHLVVVSTFWSLTAKELREEEWSRFRDDVPFSKSKPGRLAVVCALVCVAAAVPVSLLVRLHLWGSPGQETLGRLANVTLRSWQGDGRLDLHGADLRFADLTGSDLRGADLRGADLRHAILEDVDLTGASLGRLRTKKDWKSTRLNGAVLVNAKFIGADLTQADLSEANLESSDFSGAVLEGAILNKVNARDALFVAANLRHAQFIGADLTGSDFSLASMASTNLLVARLLEAKLIFAEPAREMTGVDLRDADLRGVQPVVLENIDANGVIFDGGSFCPSLRWVDIRGAKFAAEPVDARLFRERLDELSELELKTPVLRHVRDAARRVPNDAPPSSASEGHPPAQVDMSGEPGSARNEGDRLPRYDVVAMDAGLFDRCPRDPRDQKVLPTEVPPDVLFELMAHNVWKRVCYEPIAMEVLADRVLADKHESDDAPEWDLHERVLKRFKLGLGDSDPASCPQLWNLKEEVRDRLQRTF